MKPKNPVSYIPQSLIVPASSSRRTFVKGLAAGGTLAALSPWLDVAPSAFAAIRSGAPVLSGTEFDLVIENQPVNFTGKPRVATMINGSIPAPTLRWRLGDTITLRVTNRLRETTSIHWHGIILPFEMDGVPGISYPGIAPGETFTYRFKVQQTGTYWYHSHSANQEQTGMYGAIVIDGVASTSSSKLREHVIVLSDWTDENPEAVFRKLKVHSDYFNFNHPTLPQFMQDVSDMGMSGAMGRRQMFNEMRMSPTDLADVSGYTYTYLMNGTTPAGNWTGLFKPGEKVRLRFVNAAANSFYDVRIPGLKLAVVQTDGQDVEPVSVDEFRFGPGETMDVIVSPSDDAYTIFAQSMDRSGFARGTLAVREGLSAAVPETDPVEWLTMRDMMGNMSHGAHAGHGTQSGQMDHSAMTQSEMGQAEMAQSEMDQSTMNHTGAANGAHSGHQMPTGNAHTGQMNHSSGASQRVRHARSEFGPSVDMRVDMPRTNLDDPGIGLRNNGRRVLTYADLSTIGGPMDPRGAEREIELHLTGNMERYTWSFDGLEFGQSTPVHFRYGERLRVILHNDTMMTHPMHMHGMWSELEEPDGSFQTRKHTISVQPAQRISFLVDVDARGRWAWHCHLMFHMHAGMFREIVVS